MSAEWERKMSAAVQGLVQAQEAQADVVTHLMERVNGHQTLLESLHRVYEAGQASKDATWGMLDALRAQGDTLSESLSIAWGQIVKLAEEVERLSALLERQE